MKTKLLNQKKAVSFYVSAALLLCMNVGHSQQVIGEFPTMNGGVEGQVAETTTLPTISSSGTTSYTDWSIGSSSNAGTKEIVVGATARSGDSFLAQSLAAAKDNSRTQAPTNPASNYLLSGADYVIQFFYRAAVNPGTYVAGAIYLNGTADGTTWPSTTGDGFVANTWMKYAETKTTKGGVTIADPAGKGPGNYACVRLGGEKDGMLATVDVDDFVVYAGSVIDVIAPAMASDATAVRVGQDVTVKWTASADVDGGGYVVVRYATDANADNDPNQNGIYIVDSVIKNGTGALEGTVVYIGTATEAIITNPDASDYTYKIYTVDKAFNYSDEVTVKSSAALGVAKNEISGLKVYPNPVTNGKVFINSAKSGVITATVFDILGKQLIQDEVANGFLNVSSLSQGVYLIKISEGTATSTRKLVIK